MLPAQYIRPEHDDGSAWPHSEVQYVLGLSSKFLVAERVHQGQNLCKYVKLLA